MLSARPAFTLIELLVSIAVVGVLMSLLLPTIRGARESSRQTVCASNLRQLSTANGLYADSSRSHYAPGAADFLHNLSRWHGSRAHPSEPFLSTGGALCEYIDAEPATDSRSVSTLRACPTFAGELRELNERNAGFEVSNGGYGYNNAFVGVVRRRVGGHVWTVQNDRVGAALSAFTSPCRTLEFADSAFASEEGARGVIEYSFVEPRFWPDSPAERADPSIHFRHHASAGAAWLDGHVTTERFADTWSSGIYGVDPRDVGIGWFGPDASNEAFDLE